MTNKSTDEMLGEILATKNIDKYVSDNKENYVDTTVSKALEDILNEKKLVKSEVIKKAEMSEIYGYQIFSGTRNPSRDKLISIAIGMSLTLDETQTLLKKCSFAPLYAKSKRDSIIIFGISNNHSILQINETLFDAEEQTL